VFLVGELDQAIEAKISYQRLFLAKDFKMFVRMIATTAKKANVINMITGVGVGIV
jgi:hypothetical protein